MDFYVSIFKDSKILEIVKKLTAGGGAPSQCGWLKDKFGLSWQIIPSALMKRLADKDAGKSKRVMEAMLQMSKIDINRLKQAYEQR
jgi:predicted 3-demethylubiquinone-9 3-methyltransferase (glyoxalase superfamily)